MGKKSYAYEKSIAQSEITKFYYTRSEDSRQSTNMMYVVKIHSKASKYT